MSIELLAATSSHTDAISFYRLDHLKWSRGNTDTQSDVTYKCQKWSGKED